MMRSNVLSGILNAGRRNFSEMKFQWRTPRRRRDFLTGMAFLSPSLIPLLIFTYIPIAWAFNLSFTSWEARSTPDAFVGLQNYAITLSEPEFWNAFKNTLYFSAIKIPLDMVLALGIALLLNQKLRGISFFRMAYFLPVITSVVAVAAIWRVIYNPSFGLLNSLLDALGLPAQRWLRDPNLAMPSVAFVALWKGLGYDVVIFLAGLQGISRMYYEAAEIDGASSWQRFRYITLPLLSPITFFVLVVGIINSFKVFSLIHVLVPDGGPLNSAEVIVFYLYRVAFQEFKFGQAAAVSFILLAVVLFITYLQRRFIEPRVTYE
ncbi:MAG: sugar ABC transporter permease [Anaerolineae bacterium]|nr:sugar ABC transporter permease [Anaerolineae bacterium]